MRDEAFPRENERRGAGSAAKSSQTWPIPGGYTCPNCGTMRYPGLTHFCPTLRRLSPLGGGPNPYGK